MTATNVLLYLALGSALSLVLGAARGVTNKVSVRDGLPWVQWSGTSLAIFTVSLISKPQPAGGWNGARRP